MTLKEWDEKIVPNYAVPTTLYEHQVDAMSLLKQGRNVFLGNNGLLHLQCQIIFDPATE